MDIERRNQAIDAIAGEALRAGSLEPVGHDGTDFREFHIAAVRRALRLAYMAGYEQAVTDRKPPEAPDDTSPAGICPYCGESDHDKLLWNEAGVSVTCQSCGTNYIVIPLD